MKHTCTLKYVAIFKQPPLLTSECPQKVLFTGTKSCCFFSYRETNERNEIINSRLAISCMMAARQTDHSLHVMK